MPVGAGPIGRSSAFALDCDIAHLVRRALEGGVLVDGVRATAAFGIRSSALNGPSPTGIPPPDSDVP